MNPTPEAFRELMGRWATGVSVVTARGDSGDVGLTVNAFLSVSLAPPTLLISLTREADTTPVLLRSGRFAVNLLAHDQRPLSERFAEALPPEEKFRGLSLRRGEGGVALLEGTLGALEARLTERLDVADHCLILGEVTTLHRGREVAPLLFFRSRYAESDGLRSLTLADPAPPKG